MAVEVKLTGKPLEQRISDRLKSSCGTDSDVYSTQGTGPTRVNTAIHYSGSAKQYGPPKPAWRSQGPGQPAKPMP
jgi:hypothetical protein